MAQEINISKDLYDLLVSKNFDPQVTDAQGRETTPDEGSVFKFDYVSSSGKNYGTAVALIGDDKELMLFFGDNLGKSMDDEGDKDEWFSFLQQLSKFATRHNFHTFTPKNLNAIKHTMAGMAAIKEGLFEGYYGNRRVSYMGEATDARLVIKHNRLIGEDDKRYRYVESLFIETADGERFRLPFTKLVGGRAMLEHVRHGGKPYDVRGVHIAETVNEMAVLARFNRASQNKMFEGQTQQLVEAAKEYYHNLQNNLKHMGTARGYQNYFESWTPADVGAQEALVEDLKTMFIEQTLDTRIEAALPTLAKIQGSTMKEANEFESWANRLVEGTWALPETPEAKDKLYSLLNQELPVGPDAANATEQLYDILGDDELFDRLSELADRDANADARPVIIARMKEMGMEVPGVKSEPEVNEGDNLATFEGDTEDAIAAFLSRGGEIQRGKYHKPRKSEKTDYGSRHIGGMRDAVAGKAGKTLGRAAATNFMGGGKAVVGEEMDESMGATVAGAVAPLEEGSSDYVGNAIEDLRVSMPGLDRERFLDELYTYIDARYGKRAADAAMDHGDDSVYDEYYTNYSDLTEGADNREAGRALQSLKNLAVMKPALTMQNLVQAGKEAIVDNAIMACKQLKQQYLQNKQQGNAQFIYNLENEIDSFKRGYNAMTQDGDTMDLSDLLRGTLSKINFKQGVGEDSTDPMDHRGAVTDSFYEDLDRLKKLAFVKRT